MLRGIHSPDVLIRLNAFSANMLAKEAAVEKNPEKLMQIIGVPHPRS
jgi:hypothetical protein